MEGENQRLNEALVKMQGDLKDLLKEIERARQVAKEREG
jgi:hypothetical protein